MEKQRKKLIAATAELLLGALLMGCHLAGLIEEYWSSFGFALLIIGIANFVRYRRYRKDADYREKVDISNQDERLQFLAMKAWAWAGYLFVILGGVATIVLRILGMETASLWVAYSACLLMVLFWINYLWLSKKY